MRLLSTTIVTIAVAVLMLTGCASSAEPTGTTEAALQVCQPDDCPDEGYTCKVVRGHPVCTPTPLQCPTGLASCGGSECLSVFAECGAGPDAGLYPCDPGYVCAGNDQWAATCRHDCSAPH